MWFDLDVVLRHRYVANDFNSEAASTPVHLLTAILGRPMLKITSPASTPERRSGDVLIVCDEIDMSTSRELVTSILTRALRTGEPVRVDLSGVTFIDCAGLGALLIARRSLARYANTLILVRPSAPALRLLQLTGLTGAFTTEWPEA